MSPSTSPAASPTRARSWNHCLAAAPGKLDLDVPASSISGVIPHALRGGRMLSNGPGWNVIGGMNVHPFDGHGYVRSFAFRPDGSCRVTARFVETPSYATEATAGRFLHRGFATNRDGPFWRNIGFGQARNVANTTVTRWNERLLAGWEAGAPYALDAHTLATRGEEHFGGAIEGQATLAHMRHDGANERLIVCSVKNGRRTSFTFREISREDRVVATHTASIDGMLFTHDFAFTPRWFVLGGNPLRVKPGELARMLTGTSTLLRAVAVDADATPTLHLIPRSGQGPVRSVRLPDRAWVVHFGNAFERGDDLIVDACVFHCFEFGEEFGYTGPHSPFDPSLPDARGPQRLYRITVPAGGAEARWERLTEHGVDFPRFHPEHEGRDTPALFGATRRDTRFSDPFDSIIRIDLADRARPASLWTAPDDVFVGEPIFVPSPERPDAGHVLVLLSHGLENRSSLNIFDATALERGPLATVPLPLLPIAFHGDWDARGIEA